MAKVCHKQESVSTTHEQLGHLILHILKLIYGAVIFPNELANVDAPICPGCTYGKAHRKPTKRKRVNNKKHLRKVTAPGQVVRIDEVVRPTPGFIPTNWGRPTTQRYVGATLFVDYFSDFAYIHLMEKLDGESTIKAKHTFEHVCKSHSKTLQYHHSGNRLFETNIFKDTVSTDAKTLSFCGVNAHHQNGKSENCVKDVTTKACTSLPHTVHQFPEAIHAELWPADLKN